MESDYRYYTRRAAEERRRAAHAVTSEARERHKELASLFALKAQERAHGFDPHPMEERQLARG